MQEIWKNLKIEGLEKYQASNTGKIRNTNTGKILIQNETPAGYFHIVLYKTIEGEKAKPQGFCVHRLILQTFKPCNNFENLQVNHIDHNRKNNNLNNLEWTTAKENCNKKAKKKYKTAKPCFDNFGNRFESFHEAGRFWNISANTVKNDCMGKTKRPENYKGRPRPATFHF